MSYLNFSSMLLIVVLVIMVQFPPDSEMVITGVLAMAAFLSMKPTLSSLRKFSYPSSETRVKVPEFNIQMEEEEEEEEMVLTCHLDHDGGGDVLSYKLLLSS